MSTTAITSAVTKDKRRPITRRHLRTLALTVLFVLLAFVFVLPLYWMALSSSRPPEYIYVEAMNLVPTHTSSINYETLVAERPIFRWIYNSVTQAGGYAILAVCVCTMGGYALAKFQFPFRNLLFLLIIVAQMLPFHLLIVSLFIMLIQLGLVEKYLGAILPLAASPIGIFFMRQFMLSIDDELLDAARVDGANEYRLFFSIVIPNIRPAIAVLLLLFSLEYWNNLLWPLIVFREAENMPLAVGIATLDSLYETSPGLIMAASTLATVPIIILFFFLRRQFMEGIAFTGTGMK